MRNRVAAARNAASSRGGGYIPALVAGVCALLAVVVGLGHFAAPSLLEVPRERATPTFGGRAPMVGDAALEAAFWLGVLLAAFFAFRVMESLFRAGQVRALELLPVTPGAIFAERVVNAGMEALALTTVAAAFFAPLAWHSAANITGLCVLIVGGGLLGTAAATIGANAWLGAQYGGASGLGDMYGGQGGAFIYAPVVSFAIAVLSLMMLELGAREVLHEGQLTNAFWLAIGIAGGVCTATLISGGRHFVTAYHRVAAFFREADDVGYRAVMDYQKSEWDPVPLERGPGVTRFVHRRHVRQFARAFPVARSVTVIGCVAGAVGALFVSPGAFPNWVVALVPATLVVVLERPFARLDEPALGGQSDALLPIDAAVLDRARMGWSGFEVFRVALPYAVVAGAARGWTAGPLTGVMIAATSLAVAGAVAGLAALVRSLGATGQASATATSVIGCVALAGAAAVNPWIAAAVGLVLTIVSIVRLQTSGTR